MEYKGMKIEVERNSYGDYVLSTDNAMVVCDEPNDKALKKLYRASNKEN